MAIMGSAGETGISPKLLIQQAKAPKGVGHRRVENWRPFDFKSCLPDSASGRHRKGKAMTAVVFLGSGVRFGVRFRRAEAGSFALPGCQVRAWVRSSVAAQHRPPPRPRTPESHGHEPERCKQPSTVGRATRSS